MSAFLIADVNVTDLDEYLESGCLEAVPELAAKYDGQYRVLGPNIEVLEGDWSLHRLAIIKFPDIPDYATSMIPKRTDHIAQFDGGWLVPE